MSEMTIRERADWLVYSRAHNAWWRPNAAGYCTHIDGAGRYTKEKADACASSRSVTDPEAPPEFVVPAPEAYQAIAARLKALEDALRSAPHAHDCAVHWGSAFSDRTGSWRPGPKPCNCYRAILDTVREDSDASA